MDIEKFNFIGSSKEVRAARFKLASCLIRLNILKEVYNHSAGYPVISSNQLESLVLKWFNDSEYRNVSSWNNPDVIYSQWRLNLVNFFKEFYGLSEPSVSHLESVSRIIKSN